MLVLAATNILLRRIQIGHPTQNLVGSWAVCRRPIEGNELGLSTAKAAGILLRIERTNVRLGDDRDELYREWRQLVTDYGVSGKKSHDARLAAAMRIDGVSHVLTFNVDDFRRFEGIAVLQPIELV